MVLLLRPCCMWSLKGTYQFALTDIHDRIHYQTLQLTQNQHFSLMRYFYSCLFAIWYYNVCLYVCELWQVGHLHMQNVITLLGPEAVRNLSEGPCRSSSGRKLASLEGTQPRAHRCYWQLVLFSRALALYWTAGKA